MASIYWRNGVAWGKAQRGGKVYRRSLKTADQGTAERRLSAWVKELDSHRAGRVIGDFTVREAVDRFIEEHLPTLKPKAIMRYDTSIGHLLQHFGAMRLRDISSKDLSAFEQARRKMRHRGRAISPVTIKRDLACLSSVISSAEEWEWADHNPVKAYIRGRAKKGALVEGEPRARYLSHDEERRLIAHLPDTIREAAVFAIDTGLRAEEQWTLTRPDINFARRRVTVQASVAKSGKSRVVPLLPRAAEIVERRRGFNQSDYIFWRGDGDRVEHTWAYREFQKGVKAAGLDDVEWHDLRRTCGCRLLQDRGMSMEVVSKWLGHSSVRVTERHYAFLSIDDLEKAIQKGTTNGAAE
jgi:integrase